MSLGGERGYGLIEVLIVTAIIGILAGVAIAQYSSFRARGYDAQVTSAVRHVASAEEKFFISNQRYSNDVSQLGSVAQDGVEITITPSNSGDLASSFRVRGSHPAAGKSFEWVSDPPAGEPNLVEGS